MKYIEKRANNEPREVIEKRNTDGTTFDSLPKKILRTALLKEQGYLCAYCTKRIKNNSVTRIEHFVPRKPDNEKAYMNLLAVCDGNELAHKSQNDSRSIKEKELKHCDVLKQNQKINISPLDKSCELLVQFSTSGEVYSNDTAVDLEIKEILGLNHETLIRERKLILNEVRKSIKDEANKNKDNKIRKGQLKSMISNWIQKNHKNQFYPFCRVAINYLEKRISRL